MKKNVLSFKTHKVWVLYVQSFENYTKGSGMTESCSFTKNLKPGQYYKKVLELENKYRKGYMASVQRNVVYCYYVYEYEIMTDNRSKFGHDNQSSEKRIAQTIPVSYVRGEIITIGEALAKSFNDKFSPYVRATLSNFISQDLNLKIDDLKEDDLSKKIVMIPGEKNRETFFCELSEGSTVNSFTKEMLSPIRD
ncbi:MAG: hypothetical protein WC603_04085 [Candidatus Paceibacterota bacterium]|jgi:hypothetical protein